jgi:hypothetical protein
MSGPLPSKLSGVAGLVFIPQSLKGVIVFPSPAQK